jgi:hypothetical protein
MRGDDKAEPLEIFRLIDPKDENVEYDVQIKPVGNLMTTEDVPRGTHE